MKTKWMIFVLAVSFIFFFTFCAFASEGIKADPTLIHFDPNEGYLVIITGNIPINPISFEITLQSGWILVNFAKTYILEGFPLASYFYHPIQNGWHMIGGMFKILNINV